AEDLLERLLPGLRRILGTCHRRKPGACERRGRAQCERPSIEHGHPCHAPGSAVLASVRGIRHLSLQAGHAPRQCRLALPSAPNILECARASDNAGSVFAARGRALGARMPDISRRDFARLAGAAGVGLLAAPARPRVAVAQGTAKVVIVGGGAGGATVAHYVKMDAPELDVTLIETNPIYSSSFLSNLYLGGFRSLESLNHAYSGLARFGIKVVHDTAVDV